MKTRMHFEMALEIRDTIGITIFEYLLMQSSLKVKGVELYISFEDMMPTKLNSGHEIWLFY